MSDGFRGALEEFIYSPKELAKSPADGQLRFFWDYSEPDEWVYNPFTNEFKKKDKKEQKDSWFNPVCECGAEKVKTTHATYCPKYREYK